MITGAVIFLMGLGIGWVARPLPYARSISRDLRGIARDMGYKQAKIVNMDENNPLDII